MLRKALIIVAGLAAPWLLLEVALLVAGYEAPDLRTRVAVFPRFPAFYEPDRERGWKLRADLDWQGRELWQPFSTDSHGHRRNPDAGAESRSSTIDALGDSTTFGYGVLDDQSWPAVLQESLRAGGVISPEGVVRNLAVPGYTSHEARILAETDGHHAPVTLVLVGFNDHFSSVRPRHRGSRVRQFAYACFASRACSLVFDLASRPGDPQSPPQRAVPPRYQPEVSPARYTDNLTAIVRSLRSRGSEPVLLGYPPLDVNEETIQGIARHFSHPIDQVRQTIGTHDYYRNLTREVASNEGVAFVDLAPLFAGRNAELHLDWVHPNAEGLEIIARAVQPAVRAALAVGPDGNG